MDAFYGPHHERPSGLCLVTGALSQSRETFARGLLVSETRAYVLERYTWSKEPVEKKKGRKTTGGDEATHLVNEGIVTGVKNQIFRTTTESGETKVLTTQKLRQMFPDSAWARKRARESLNETMRSDPRPEDRLGEEQVDTSQKNGSAPWSKEESKTAEEVRHPEEDVSMDVSHAQDAAQDVQSTEADAEAPRSEGDQLQKRSSPDAPSDPLSTDGAPVSQPEQPDETHTESDMPSEPPPAPLEDHAQAASPAAPSGNPHSEEPAETKDPQPEHTISDVMSEPPPPEDEAQPASAAAEEAEEVAPPRRRRSSRVAQDPTAKRRRASPSSQSPLGRRRSSRLR